MSDTTAVTEELKKALAAEEGGRRWLRRLAIAGGIAAVIAGGLFWDIKHRPPPPARYVSAQVTTGDVAEKVQATGTVQPVLQINVGAVVSGRVTDVYVDFNSHVRKDEPLAEIDPRIYKTQVNAQQAGLLGQRAQYEQAKANVLAVKAQMDTAKTNLEQSLRLFSENLMTKADLDTARGQLDMFKGQYDAAVAGVNSQQAAISASDAQLRQSTTNLSYTKIFSPIDGVVITRAIDPGQTVAASFQAPVLFVIAQDLRKMRVLADIDEADVGKLKEGMARRGRASTPSPARSSTAWSARCASAPTASRA